MSQVAHRSEVDVMSVMYRTMPTSGQFQKDSSVNFAVRADDRILKHIDWLLERYEVRNRTGPTFDWSLRRVILCDLFLTCQFWIRSYMEKNLRMKPERYPAVFALLNVTLDELAMLLE